MRAVIATLLCAGFLVVRAHAGSVTGRATVDGTPASDGIVYLEGADSGPASPSPRHAAMDQKNLTFVPALLPIVRGTVVDFTNSDDVQHNVFSPSPAGGKFNLGTYGPGAGRSVTFDETGDVVVLCNIHMEMEAHILVLANHYFSTVAPDGRYRIESVPAGTYALRIWKGRWLPPSDKVEVSADGTLEVDVSR
jgi:plastocyanin